MTHHIWLLSIADYLSSNNDNPYYRESWYIGTVLTEVLKPNYKIIGYDVGFFKDSTLTTPIEPHQQIYKDIRDINEKDLKNVDYIIHLAVIIKWPIRWVKSKIDKRNKF